MTIPPLVEVTNKNRFAVPFAVYRIKNDVPCVGRELNSRPTSMKPRMICGFIVMNSILYGGAYGVLIYFAGSSIEEQQFDKRLFHSRMVQRTDHRTVTKVTVFL